LGDSDFRVLEVLLHKGAMPVNMIGPKVNLTPGSISTAVERLHSRGLVSRVEDREDRRVRVVDLTAEGRALIETVFNEHAVLLEEAASVLSPDERTNLEALLKKIGRNAEHMSRGKNGTVADQNQ
jgi:MarR family 2-MHQ and catechol resistance regulon transcriptional repressor